MALVHSDDLDSLVDETSGREIVAAPTLVNRFAELTKKYEPFLNFGDRREWLKNNVQKVLSPCDINIFLQQTREYENHKNYRQNTGLFVTRLIQNSCKAGNNDFELDLKSLKPIDYLAFEISGTKERRVSITVKGRAGDLCGSRAKYSTFIIEEAERQLGFEVEHSTFTIGRAGDGCGSGAMYSTFTIEKAGDWCGCRVYSSIFTIEETGNNCGYSTEHSIFAIKETGSECGRLAQHSTFTIEKAGDGCGWDTQHSTFTIGTAGKSCGEDSIYSVFQSTDQNLIKDILRNIPRFKNNKVYHIQPDGTLKKRWF